MPVKFVIKKGFGFSPGSVKYIPTHGFSVGEAPVTPPPNVVIRGTATNAVTRGNAANIVRRS